ncbi:PREDICTED: lipid phosphate phosphatase-related protein type 5 [Merops nubicus]|uniref:lipid phosphate phosphatase-related protein type 5 n=1 Tax=Merops nubicus TaxID=57421 RepID=UPI0004F07388|nr:PREDICTED: lipid phosphate phosphatase-related protein type 5 [Merops nubicus]
MRLSVQEDCTRNEELVLRWTVGHTHAHLDGDEDSPAVRVVLFALVAKCSYLSEVSTSVRHGDSSGAFSKDEIVIPVILIIVGETAVFCLQLATKDFENQEKTILTGDCCYINPLVRRTIRFLGIYTFGLFATDIFVNAGQVVTGNLAPHFLALCKPNYTALGCKQYTQFISSVHACTGNPDLIMKARKTFPSKEAALSVYAAMYLAVSILYHSMPLCLGELTAHCAGRGEEWGKD